MQGTGVQSPVREDSLSEEQLSPCSTATEAACPGACAPQQRAPLLSETRESNEDLAQPKRYTFKKIFPVLYNTS